MEVAGQSTKFTPVNSLLRIDRLWLSVALSLPGASRVPTFNTSPPPPQLSAGIHPYARMLDLAPGMWPVYLLNLKDIAAVAHHERDARNLMLFWIISAPIKRDNFSSSSSLPMTAAADDKHGLQFHLYFLHIMIHELQPKCWRQSRHLYIHSSTVHSLPMTRWTFSSHPSISSL